MRSVLGPARKQISRSAKLSRLQVIIDPSTPLRGEAKRTGLSRHLDLWGPPASQDLITSVEEWANLLSINVLTRWADLNL